MLVGLGLDLYCVQNKTIYVHYLHWLIDDSKCFVYIFKSEKIATLAIFKCKSLYCIDTCFYQRFPAGLMRWVIGLLKERKQNMSIVMWYSFIRIYKYIRASHTSCLSHQPKFWPTWEPYIPMNLIHSDESHTSRLYTGRLSYKWLSYRLTLTTAVFHNGHLAGMRCCIFTF